MQENVFESVVCETVAILSRPQCSNPHGLITDQYPNFNGGIMTPPLKSEPKKQSNS